MRTVYDSSGADVTSTVSTYLQVNRTLILSDLFRLQCVQFWNYNPYATLTNFFFSSADHPIGVNNLQSGPNFVETISAIYPQYVIERDQLNYGIGFEAQTLNITLYPDDIQTLSGTTLRLKEGIMKGYFDNNPFWMHRAYEQPSAIPGGPPTLLGTTLMFRGYIQGAEAGRDYLKITVTSLMDIFQQTQIPTQLIQPGNRVPPYLATFAPGGGFAQLTVSTGSTPTEIRAAAPGTPVADGSYRDMFIVGGNAFQYVPVNGTPPPALFRIRDNYTSGGIIYIYPYEPIDPPTLVTAGTYMFLFGQVPLNTGGDAVGAPGFAFVPIPETSA